MINFYRFHKNSNKLLDKNNLKDKIKKYSPKLWKLIDKYLLKDFSVLTHLPNLNEKKYYYGTTNPKSVFLYKFRVFTRNHKEILEFCFFSSWGECLYSVEVSKSYD